MKETGRGSDSLWWAKKPALRKVVILTALERRAGFRKANQPGTHAERYQRAIERLNAKNRAARDANELERCQLEIEEPNRSDEKKWWAWNTKHSKCFSKRTALKLELQLPTILEDIVSDLMGTSPHTIRQIAAIHKLRKSAVSKWLYRLEAIARELSE
jgi:hypothetical protein